MTVTRNTGSDIIPFAPRPSYPGARLRAVQDARARREREAPPPDAAYTAEWLRRDLAAVPVEVVLNGKQRDHLRRMGWTDERYARASADLRGDQVRRVHPRSDPAVTAAGGTPGRGRMSGTSAHARPPVAVPQRVRDLRGERLNVAQARAMGIDPLALWPSLRGLLPDGDPDLRAGGRPGRPRAFEGLGRANTPSRANLRAQGGRRR
jgi:hypothetical protein